MFRHHVYNGNTDEDIEDETRSLPEFADEQNRTKYTPFAVQPELYPSNGSHMLLKFRYVNLMLIMQSHSRMFCLSSTYMQDVGLCGGLHCTTTCCYCI